MSGTQTAFRFQWVNYTLLPVIDKPLNYFAVVGFEPTAD
ncbi:hypothetical protein [Salmonella phage PLL1]|uniref:Uncharacterized protein n=2 Tax=Caudoviricetes TaxID=2731619 RepID=A0A1X9I9K8_9CAUD|nr:hypothetical protein vB_SenM-2_191 [Salmonella phage vB_SenM-2]AYJ73688.1 hypothetical protein PS5_133 [Salmonella phage PS5]QFR58820.1 hypothetical protein Phi10_174 [Salmonella phage vB_SentM_Phi_10]UMO77673.1 hypothetical protein [Salmonella phage PLL1]